MMSPAEIQSTFTSFMPALMNVYTENLSTGPSGGRFDVLTAANTGIRCRPPFGVSQGRQEPERAEDLGHRQVNWDATYQLPDTHCQLEINGERWQPIAGTVRPRYGIGGEIWQWSAQVIKVVT